MMIREGCEWGKNDDQGGLRVGARMSVTTMDTATSRSGPKISTGYLRGRRSLTGGKDKKASVGGDKRLSASSRDRRASADAADRRGQGDVGRWASSEEKRISSVTGKQTKQETKKDSVVDSMSVSQEVCDRINNEVNIFQYALHMTLSCVRRYHVRRRHSEGFAELQEGLLTLRVMLTDLQDIRATRDRTPGVRGVVLGVADLAASLSREQAVWIPFVSSSLIVLLLCQLVRLFFR
ncbi:hypothetical protein Bbelb_412220 [Branchiostoma belcheri]|nr:hypothetical protein Bbelb_412220 [Branchiostoma belcheri]